MSERWVKCILEEVIPALEMDKWLIKDITAEMESLAETMDSCPEKAMKYKLLSEELRKFKIMASNKEKIIQLVDESSFKKNM